MADTPILRRYPAVVISHLVEVDRVGFRHKIELYADAVTTVLNVRLILC